MAARWIVPAFDVAEDRHPGLGLRCKPSPCEQLAFQGCEEALAHGVIVRIADGSHGRSYAGLATTAAEGQSRILAALIAVVNDNVRLALADRHLQRGQHELSSQMCLHRPTNNPAAECI